MTADVLVSVEHLWRRYGELVAVQDLNFQLRRGEVLGFLGPNGAGKSSTMQILAGNLAPSAGRIRIEGIDLLDEPDRAKGALGYLPEQPPLYAELSVREFLRFCARLHDIPQRNVEAAVDRALQRCGLADVAKRLIGNLSKGYQQRVGIAQAIIHEPAVVILDEPTVGLDPIQIRDIRALIKELGGEHSVILSTHILPEVEMVCDHVQIIHKGKLVFNGSIDVLRQQRHGNKLILGLKHPPANEELLKIPGIVSADPLPNGLLRLQYAEGQTPEETLVQAAVNNNWGLYQINPDQTTLEEVFVQLTFQEMAA